MNWQGLKIPIIIVSLLAGMALFFAGQCLYQKYNYNDPLNRYLSSNQAIEAYNVITHGNMTLVEVALNHEAELMSSYHELNRDLNNILNPKNFQLNLLDNRDAAIEKVWSKCQYAVYEASYTGNFTEMAVVVNGEAQAGGVEATINIDHDQIYLSMQHQGHTLRKVIQIRINQNGSSGFQQPLQEG
ncbi:MAG: hypothetical protein ACOX0T_04475 [Pelotomaculum sp.]|jgi:hypothetical protein